MLKIRFTGSHDALDTGAISYRRKSASMVQRDNQRLRAFISAKEGQSQNVEPGSESVRKLDYTDNSPGKDSGLDHSVELGGVDFSQSTSETRSPEQMSLERTLDPNVTPFMPQPGHDNNKQSADCIDPNTDTSNFIGASADINPSGKEEKVKRKSGKKNNKTAPQCMHCKTFILENELFFRCSQCLKDDKIYNVCPECQPYDRPHNRLHINYILCVRYNKTDNV